MEETDKRIVLGTRDPDYNMSGRTATLTARRYVRACESTHIQYKIGNLRLSIQRPQRALSLTGDMLTHKSYRLASSSLVREYKPAAVRCDELHINVSHPDC